MATARTPVERPPIGTTLMVRSGKHKGRMATIVKYCPQKVRVKITTRTGTVINDKSLLDPEAIDWDSSTTKVQERGETQLIPMVTVMATTQCNTTLVSNETIMNDPVIKESLNTITQRLKELQLQGSQQLDN